MRLAYHYRIELVLAPEAILQHLQVDEVPVRDFEIIHVDQLDTSRVSIDKGFELTVAFKNKVFRRLNLEMFDWKSLGS